MVNNSDSHNLKYNIELLALVLSDRIRQIQNARTRMRKVPCPVWDVDFNRITCRRCGSWRNLIRGRDFRKVCALFLFPQIMKRYLIFLRKDIEYSPRQEYLYQVYV